MKNLIKKILVYLNLSVVVLLFFSYLSEYISPEKIWVIAFFGLAYPYILAINFLFLLYWIILKKRYFLISLIAILLGWSNLKKLVQLRPAKEFSAKQFTTIKLISYNVRLFNYYRWVHDNSIPANIFKFFKSENPDIICLQEYFTLDKGEYSAESIVNKFSSTPYRNIKYTSITKGLSNFGIATFSSYPIVNKGYIKFENSLNICIYSDIKINNDTIRVYNTHLQSIRLKKNNYNFIDSLILSYNNKHLDEVKDISSRLKHAYIKRARQVDILSAHIRQSPYPVIVCGDFNDTPVSYTYHKMKGKLVDTFVESGSGIGNTYLGNFPSFRIDYIFHSKSFHSCCFQTERMNMSDHYPVMCTLSLN